MANTYTQLGIHFVTAVKGRESLIDPAWRPEIHAYLGKLFRLRRHEPIQCHMQPDHVHAFASLHPTDSISDCVGSWKAKLSGFISRRYGIDFDFQRGYSAFAVSKRSWQEVIDYIDNQDKIHARRKFRVEYENILREHGIDYDARYLFDEVHVG